MLVASMGLSLKVRYFNGFTKDTITPTIKEGDRHAITSLCFIAFVDQLI